VVVEFRHPGVELDVLVLLEESLLEESLLEESLLELLPP